MKKYLLIIFSTLLFLGCGNIGFTGASSNDENTADNDQSETDEFKGIVPVLDLYGACAEYAACVGEPIDESVSTAQQSWCKRSYIDSNPDCQLCVIQRRACSDGCNDKVDNLRSYKLCMKKECHAKWFYCCGVEQ